MMRIARSIQILWAILLVSLWSGFIFSMPFDPDYTAGELLDHVSNWISAHPLYASIQIAPYRVLNYPPLYLWGVKILSGAGLNPLVAGRMLNLLAFLLLLVLLYRWLRAEACGRMGALFVLSLAATSFPLLYSVGQLHLELSAVAMYMGGCYLIRRPGSVSRFLSAGVVVALSCFLKQTYVVFSLIPILWLARYHFRSSLLFLAAYVATGLLGVFWLHHLFGMEIWRQLITYTVGTYSLHNLLQQWTWHLLPWTAFAGLCCFLIIKQVIARSDLRAWLFIGQSIWLLSAARLGSSYQYFIAWSVVVLLCAGPWLVQWLFYDRSLVAVRSRKLLGGLFLLQIIGADLGVASVLGHDARVLREQAHDLPALCRAMGEPDGPVVVEDAGVARACGHRSAWHPFIMTSLARQGLWDPSPLLSELEAGVYPRLVLPFDPEQPLEGVHQERWLPELLVAIQLGYKTTARVGTWHVMAPM